MNTKPTNNSLPLAVAAMVIAMVMTACDRAVDSGTSPHQPGYTVKEVIRSHSNAGGQIDISHRLPQSLTVGRPATVELSFQLEPYETLEVEINNNDDFELIGNTDFVIEGNDSGLLNMRIHLVPARAGKSYLKLMAATVNGEKIRSYAIRLNVADASGRIPDRQRPPKQRIDLRSTVH